MNPTRRSLNIAALVVSIGLLDWRRTLAQGFSLQDIIERVGPLPEATIYVAREVITMDQARPLAEAVVMVGGRIAVVGSLSELQALAGSQPFRVDWAFADKVVIAGCIEQHVHPVLTALMVVAEVIAIEDWDTVAGFSRAVRDQATGAEPTVGCACGGGAFAAVISFMLGEAG